MVEAALGSPIDIHGGGHDLIFPHHENEIAQSVCAKAGHGHDRPVYARYWLHNGFLTMDSEKMSKSLGNVLLVHDLVKQVPGEAVRWALLAGHYRAPLDWTDKLIDQSVKALDRLYGVLQRAKAVAALVPSNDDVFAPLMDDLNTPQAFSQLFAMADELDQALRDDSDDAAHYKGQLLHLAGVLGLLQADPDVWFMGGADADLAAKIEGLLQTRLEARASKDFAAADRIRDELNALNVVVMDGPEGATWRLRETR
jgi:cysteinyl-tRNA synthetase